MCQYYSLACAHRRFPHGPYMRCSTACTTQHGSYMRCRERLRVSVMRPCAPETYSCVRKWRAHSIGQAKGDGVTTSILLVDAFLHICTESKHGGPPHGKAQSRAGYRSTIPSPVGSQFLICSNVLSDGSELGATNLAYGGH
jgi:hypothetical protein